MAYVDQTNNQLSFLLNFSVLSILFALLCFIVSGYHYLSSILVSYEGMLTVANFYFIEDRFTQYHERAILYLIVGVFTLGIAYIFHRAALLVVRDYGNLIRSSIDLFRSRLLIELNQELPKNSVEEQWLWERISDFILLGDRLGVNNYFEYRYRKDME